MKKKIITPIVVLSVVSMLGNQAQASEWRANSPEEIHVDPNAKTYQLKWGDTVSNLAIATNTDVQSIVNANPGKIINPDVVLTNDVINLPQHHTGNVVSQSIRDSVSTVKAPQVPVKAEKEEVSQSKTPTQVFEGKSVTDREGKKKAYQKKILEEAKKSIASETKGDKAKDTKSSASKSATGKNAEKVEEVKQLYKVLKFKYKFSDDEIADILSAENDIQTQKGDIVYKGKKLNNK